MAITDPISASDLRRIEAHLIARATASDEAEAIIAEFCEALVAAGLPLWRLSLAVPVIDPLFRGVSVAWRRGQGMAVFPTVHGPEGEDTFLRSPVGWLRANDLSFVRWRLDQSNGCPDLPLLDALRQAGGTDYLLHAAAFAPGSAMEGVGISFATDRPGGFSQAEQAVVAGLVPVIALVTAKLSLSHAIREMLDTYLGPATGARVLAGEMRRGQSTVVHAAILLADLRGFTAVADRDDPLKVVGWLDEHFDALGEPVQRHGGEISKFLGDGFLAVFPVAEPDALTCPACTGALDAAREALARNDRLNASRRQDGLPPLEADIVLHYGRVVSGNVGTDRRLDFTVIGRAVNEASRIERLCDGLERSLLLSDAFARRCGASLVPVGEFALRGVGRKQRIWGLAPEAPGPSEGVA
ncbi:adenylate/guanylate cyclase domain-containing protein [Methylorubrum extorquens]|jgi:adenylate cyclase|uniref:Adenylate cyclase protein n=2 Tax=Methylorubrum extorquens TaxID=408 RepID=C5AXR9_METEA|nr:adenylate/guanylate cyclase domain-containing protein [Methylorubrum extorquens]ACS41137.1 Putative adenylate cyclase protein [Methylorubrum extorquens AM1]EHP91916.1 adenylate/guanylate cyclase [Methylorubrum extorquens DSM 13060]MCP1540702.1 adenylate cyclase [Methylorubrum extorquens]MCP1586761.1 adenylate cyclase [Methylorubrum extorquens]